MEDCVLNSQYELLLVLSNISKETESAGKEITERIDDENSDINI